MSFAQDLKASVLQAAMQGKLTEQLETDTPVSELLADIRTEKDRLIAEKKIRKDKHNTFITEGEILTDIPSNWTFLRFGDIVANYDSQREPISKEKRKNGIYDYYGATGSIDKVADYIFDGEYLLIGEDGGNFFVPRPNSFIASGKFWANNHVHVVQPLGIDIKYLMHFLNSLNLPAMNLIRGIAVPKLNQQDLNSIITPVPPIEEQKRIVRRIEEIMKHIDELEAIEEELKKLKEAFPADMKAAVLQAAMQGKLTEQLETDSSVDDLLEDIKKEREKLVKEGKIKKSKTQNNNFVEFKDGEEPFEIPDNWRWVRFGDISTYGNSLSKISPKKIKPHMWCLDLEDIEKGTGTVIKKVYAKDRKIDGDKTIFVSGQVLYSKLRPYLLKVLIADEDGICTPELVPFSVFTGISPFFLCHMLKSAYVDNLVNSKTFGMKMPRVSTETMCNLILPIPPLEEQNRIVAKLEQILPLISDLS